MWYGGEFVMDGAVGSCSKTVSWGEDIDTNKHS